MDMKVDSSYIKRERERRAWSQEHLAEVTGLGLRTIQRIEKTGAASYESARSLAAVLGVDVGKLRIEDAPPAVRRLGAASPALGALAAVVTGGALLYATQSFADDRVLVDVSTVIKRPVTSPTGVPGQDVWEGKTQFVVDDGALANLNDRSLNEFRFSIVPHVRDGGQVLLEIGVFERHGNEEIVLSRPQLIALDGETAEVEIGAGGDRTVRLSIKAQVNPPQLPPTLHAR